ncbi:hypothetical protein C6N14_03165 [Enterococcus mundtii]|uniref:WxL domain-containing protein n=2 Tax=Enterococcus mundtii TaxID=53346 RepID=A0A2T5DF09_ENTMU|nr:hypothetical protein C6N14_03165 [Enterococcus mundtii]
MLSVTLLVLSIFLSPVGLVYAEITEGSEEQTMTELPEPRNYLDPENQAVPRFFFTRSKNTGTVNEATTVTFFADQEVSEARIVLPKEATIIKEQLPAGLSIKQDEKKHEWVLQATWPQNKFVLPLVFGKVGVYEIMVEGEPTSIEILKQEDINEKTAEASVNQQLNDEVSSNEPSEIYSMPQFPSFTDSSHTTVVDNEGNVVSGMPIQPSNLVYLEYLGNNMSQDITANGARFNSGTRFNRGTIIRIKNAAMYREQPLIVAIEILTDGTTVNYSNRGINPVSSVNNEGLSIRIFVEDEYENPYVPEGVTFGLGLLNNYNNLTSDRFYYYEVSTPLGISNVVGLSGTLDETNINPIQNGYAFTQLPRPRTDPNSAPIINFLFPATTSGFTFSISFRRQTTNQVVPVALTGHHFFTAEAPLLVPVPYDEIIANETENSDSFKAIFEVEQFIPKQVRDVFYDDPFKLTISFPSFTRLEGNLTEVKIISEYNDEIPYEIEGNRIEIPLSREVQSAIAGGKIKVYGEIELPRDASDFFRFFDNEDNFFNIPYKAKNSSFKNYQETIARVKIPAPEGKPIRQIVQINSTTNDLNPDKLVTDLKSVLPEQDKIIIKGIYEDKKFDTLGEDEVSVVIASALTGLTSTITVPIEVIMSHVPPVDPLDPETEIDPENPPVIPEDQGFLSIDFVSQFNFGPQRISVSGQTYYAQPQRLLNEDGTVNEAEERPNFVQISDRRSDDERNGWQLSVTQNGQFSNQNGHELIGSEIQLFNQELVTAQGGTMPELQEKPVQRILPNTKKVLLQADKESGTGTWIYRFGDQNTADKSVGLYVPKGTNPEATSYSTKLTWELSSVPDN